MRDASSAFPSVLAAQRLPSHAGSAEQSNTSILYGKQLFLKIYRRLQPEENPDVEVGRFLTEVAHFNRIPPFLGEISISSGSTAKTTVALLQGLVANQGDGWQWFLDQLFGWLPSVAQRLAPARSNAPGWMGAPDPIPESLEPVRSTLEAAALLGMRTAELHLAMASGTTLASFTPEPLTGAELANDADRIESQIKLRIRGSQIQSPQVGRCDLRSGGSASIPPVRTHSTGAFDSISRSGRATHPNSWRLSFRPDIADISR